MRFTAGMTLSSAVPPRCSRASRICSALVAPRPLVRINLIVSSGLEHNLIQRVFDDACCIRRLEAGDDFARSALLHDRIYRHPVGIAQVRNSRGVERWQDSENGLEIRTLHIQHEPYL